MFFEITPCVAPPDSHDGVSRADVYFVALVSRAVRV